MLRGCVGGSAPLPALLECCGLLERGQVDSYFAGWKPCPVSGRNECDFFTAHLSVLASLVNIRTYLVPVDSGMCLGGTCHRPYQKGFTAPEEEMSVEPVRTNAQNTLSKCQELIEEPGGGGGGGHTTPHNKNGSS